MCFRGMMLLPFLRFFYLYLELFPHCGIFLELFPHCGIFLELLPHCGIFFYIIGTIRLVAGYLCLTTL